MADSLYELFYTPHYPIHSLRSETTAISLQHNPPALLQGAAVQLKGL